MLDTLRTARGVMRSLGVYYGRKSRGGEKDRLYAQFVKAGDLVFDVGAHVGDRVASFRNSARACWRSSHSPHLHSR